MKTNASGGFTGGEGGLQNTLETTVDFGIFAPDTKTKPPEIYTREVTVAMAEKERFELSKPFCGLHDFQSCALDQARRLLRLSIDVQLTCQKILLAFNKNVNFIIHYMI